MSYYIKSGNTFRVSADAAIDLHTKLPVGNYIIKVDPMGAMYLEQIDSFEFKGKQYGDNIRHTERIMSTFKDRTVSTGIMLAGEKGSGKSLLAKSLSIAAAAIDMPTIIINTPFKGDSFNKFMQDIDEPCVVLFDEFEKVYDSADQESILTLLDGVFPSKKLFVLTCNNKYRIDTNMRNRPGRIYYMIDFAGLSNDFIIEYCNDNLINKTHISKVCAVSGLFAEMNFDMLKAMIEEMNRYDESPQQVLKLINAKPEFDSGSKYDVEFVHNGNVINAALFDPNVFEGSPMQSNGVGVGYDPEPDNCDSKYLRFNFDSNSLYKIDPATGTFVFVLPTGEKLTLTKKVKIAFNFDAF